MKFKDAVDKTPGLQQFYKSGLQALRSRDRSRVTVEDSRSLRGSVDIDTALLHIDPNGHRWDFAIAYKHLDRAKEVIYWAEFHTASDSQVNIVIRKALWLLNWLREGGKLLAQFESDVVWVSSGATTFTLSAPQKKRMAQTGLRHVGGTLQIPNNRR